MLNDSILDDPNRIQLDSIANKTDNKMTMTQVVDMTRTVAKLIVATMIHMRGTVPGPPSHCLTCQRKEKLKESPPRSFKEHKAVNALPNQFSAHWALFQEYMHMPLGWTLARQKRVRFWVWCIFQDAIQYRQGRKPVLSKRTTSVVLNCLCPRGKYMQSQKQQYVSNIPTLLLTEPLF